jgi:hypothetical protein
MKTTHAIAHAPRVADAFHHLGFPDSFRVELSWAKLLGVVLLLAPVPWGLSYLFWRRLQASPASA